MQKGFVSKVHCLIPCFRSKLLSVRAHDNHVATAATADVGGNDEQYTNFA